MDIKDLLKEKKQYVGKEIEICGWIKNHRPQKEFGFISFSDGTTQGGIQVVYDKTLNNFEDVSKLLVSSALKIKGTLVPSEGKEDYEIKANSIEILSSCPEDYPIQPKRHSREFLREQAYLRPRTNLFTAVFRVRSVAAYAIHKYFNEHNYVYVHTPLITASDCEGAGQMFEVTTLPLGEKPDYSKDFFGKKTALTVSGQLQAETCALAYKKVYTFGPTFRAEDSNTKTHAAEFWMVEPEICFADLNDDMDLAEEMIKYIFKYVIDNYPEEMQFFNNFVDKGLLDRLNNVINSDFARISYTDAVAELEKHNDEFEYKVSWGVDLQTEHERYLCEKIFQKPVFVTDYPKEIKAFYMKLNDDGKTVAAADLLAPGIGEIIGGSQREDDYNKLLARIKELNMPIENYDWYLDLRKYGSCKHAGFGLGFERAIMYLTGMQNIRDVIPFPRTPNNCEF